MRVFHDYENALAYARERLAGWLILSDGSQIADSADDARGAASDELLRASE